MTHAHQAPAAHRLDHLGVEQARQRHPARLGGRALCPLARWLDPLAVVRQQRRRVLREAIGEEERHTARRQDLDDLMDSMLRQRQRAVADGDRHPQLGDGVDGCPDPVWRA